MGDLVRRLEREGWSVSQSRTGHLKVKAPEGRGQMTVSVSPSDWKAAEQAEKIARKIMCAERGQVRLSGS